MAPTVPTTSFPKGFTSQDPIVTYQTDICTVPVNICGLPAVSIPCGFDEKNLPIGMQLIGNRFAEANILNLAWQFEQATQGQFNKKVEGGLAL